MRTGLLAYSQLDVDFSSSNFEVTYFVYFESLFSFNVPFIL